MSDEQQLYALAICPGCLAGNLFVDGYQMNYGPSSYQLGQRDPYTPGKADPKVTVHCTLGCGFFSQLPGTPNMVGKLYFVLANPNDN